MEGKKTASDLEREFEKPGNGFVEEVSAELMKKAELVANMLTIKMNNWIPWYETNKLVVASTTEETIKSAAVRHGQIMVLTHVSASNSTNAPTTVQIWVERGGERLQLNRDVPSAADVSVDWDGQVLLSAGDRVCASSLGATAADVFSASFSGYEIKA